MKRILCVLTFWQIALLCRAWNRLSSTFTHGKLCVIVIGVFSIAEQEKPAAECHRRWSLFTLLIWYSDMVLVVHMLIHRGDTAV